MYVVKGIVFCYRNTTFSCRKGDAETCVKISFCNDVTITSTTQGPHGRAEILWLSASRSAISRRSVNLISAHFSPISKFCRSQVSRKKKNKNKNPSFLSWQSWPILSYWLNLIETLTIVSYIAPCTNSFWCEKKKEKEKPRLKQQRNPF